MTRRSILVIFLIITYTALDRGEKTNKEGEEFGPKSEETMSRDDFEGKPGRNVTICHTGWYPFAPRDSLAEFTHCIKVFSAFRMNWQQAEESCTHFSRGHLLSIGSEQEMRWVKETIQTEAQMQVSFPLQGRISAATPHSGWWIGLGQLCPNPEPDKMPVLRWTDGKFPSKENPTKIGEIPLRVPEKADGTKQYCVSYQQERITRAEVREYFNVSECSQRRNFICKMPAYRQAQSEAGIVLMEQKAGEEDEPPAEEENELTRDFPCGRDPFYCPLKVDGELMCYHLQTRAHYWQQAREACASQFASELASIHSKEESKFLYSMITMQPSITGETKYWIGLHRRNAKRQFEWSDDSPLDYMSVYTTEADGDESNEEGACTVLKLNASSRSLLSTALYPRPRAQTPPPKLLPAYSWMHQRCDNKRLSICKKSGFESQKHEDISKKEQQQQKRANWRCDDNFTLFRGMCYKIFDEAVAFRDAKRNCEEKKSTLVSLTDIYEQGFVLSLLEPMKSDAWIGMDMAAGRVRWLDAEPVHMTRFNPDIRIIKVGSDKHVYQTNRHIGFAQDACVSLDATKMVGYWDLTFNATEAIIPMKGEQSKKNEEELKQCHTKKLPFICERYAEETKEEKVEERPCYTNANGDVTYCFLSNDEDKKVNGHYSFIEGSQMCAGLPKAVGYSSLNKEFGQLAQADDLFDWSFLTSMALQNGYDEFYMGVQFKEGTGFVRTDGVRVRLTPWGSGEPNLKAGNCVVVRISKDGPTWHMASCSRRRQLVCRLTSEKPMQEVEPDVHCPKGKEDWIKGRTHCYYLVANSSLISTGYKADHDCFKYFKADLASFETKEDLDDFKKQIIPYKLIISNAFIGLIRQKEDSFAWKDLSPVSYLNWEKGYPDNTRKGENQECVQMVLHGNYEWQTVTCWQSRHFICSVRVERTSSGASEINTVGEDEEEAKEGEDNEEGDDEGDKKESGNEEEEKKNEEEKTKEIRREEKKDAKDSIWKNEKTDKEENDDGVHHVIRKTADRNVNEQQSKSGRTGTVLGAVAGIIIATILVVFYIRRRYRLHRNREQRIMQFESFHNDDEYGM